MSYTLLIGTEQLDPEISCIAKTLGAPKRHALAIEMLARTRPVSEIAQEAGVSRKFLYQQKEKAHQALADEFLKEPNDAEVLFYLPVTKKWLEQFVLELGLRCHAPIRGIMQTAEDLLNTHMAIGKIHNILHRAVEKAREINAREDLSPIKVGAHDEIFQAGKPILVGADVYSTYCYLLALEEARDGDTWAVHLLDLQDKGLHPEHTIADGGLGLRAGQAEAWPDVSCHGDIFHPLRDMGRLAVYLENRALGAISTCQKIERKMEMAKKRSRGHTLSKKLAFARRAEAIAVALADDIATLAKWLREDILALIGPDHQTRRELFDFVVEELRKRKPIVPHRIGPLVRRLENQRDDLLAFSAVLDHHMADLAEQYRVPPYRVRGVYELQGLPDTDPRRWQREAQLRKKLRGLFDSIQHSVVDIIARTIRASSVIENLNSILRNYFFLRRSIGPAYLDLLRFFLNHRRFLRSEHPERVGRSPAEILAGRRLPHWLEMLGYTLFKRAA